MVDSYNLRRLARLSNSTTSSRLIIHSRRLVLPGPFGLVFGPLNIIAIRRDGEPFLTGLQHLFYNYGQGEIHLFNVTHLRALVRPRRTLLQRVLSGIDRCITVLTCWSFRLTNLAQVGAEDSMPSENLGEVEKQFPVLPPYLDSQD